MKKRLFLSMVVLTFCRAVLAMDVLGDDVDNALSLDDVVMILDSYRTHLMIHSVADPSHLKPQCTASTYFERLHSEALPFLEALFNEPTSLLKTDLVKIEETFLQPRILPKDYKPYFLKYFRQALAQVYRIYGDIAQKFIHNQAARLVILPLLEICSAMVAAGLLPDDGYASQSNLSERRVKGLAFEVAHDSRPVSVQEFTDLVGRCVFMAATTGELHEKARVLLWAMQKIHHAADFY